MGYVGASKIVGVRDALLEIVLVSPDVGHVVISGLAYWMMKTIVTISILENGSCLAE